MWKEEGEEGFRTSNTGPLNGSLGRRRHSLIRPRAKARRNHAVHLSLGRYRNDSRGSRQMARTFDRRSDPGGVDEGRATRDKAGGTCTLHRPARATAARNQQAAYPATGAHGSPCARKEEIDPVKGSCGPGRTRDGRDVVAGQSERSTAHNRLVSKQDAGKHQITSEIFSGMY